MCPSFPYPFRASKAGAPRVELRPHRPRASARGPRRAPPPWRRLPPRGAAGAQQAPCSFFGAPRGQTFVGHVPLQGGKR
eukprot:117154-Pyramimonas_sp.AAC.1